MFTCIECEHPFDHTNGDVDERMCHECLDEGERMSKVYEHHKDNLENNGPEHPSEMDQHYKVIAHCLKDMLDEEPLTNCCCAPFTYPGYPDSDFCSKCHEHAGIDEDE